MYLALPLGSDSATMRGISCMEVSETQLRFPLVGLPDFTVESWCHHQFIYV